MTVKLLTEHHLELLGLTEGCTGSSEYTHVKMPHCWKSHVTAQIKFYFYGCVVVTDEDNGVQVMRNGSFYSLCYTEDISSTTADGLCKTLGYR